MSSAALKFSLEGEKKPTVLTRDHDHSGAKVKPKRPKSSFAPFFNASYGISTSNSNPFSEANGSYILPNSSGNNTAHAAVSTSHNYNPFYKYISNKNDKYYLNSKDDMTPSGSVKPHGNTISNYYSNSNNQTNHQIVVKKCMSNTLHNSQFFTKKNLVTASSPNSNSTLSIADHLIVKAASKPREDSEQTSDPNNFFNSNSNYYKSRSFQRYR